MGCRESCSDTMGFDMKPSFRQVWEKVRAKWYDRIPDAARPPTNKTGHVPFQFRVMKDGHINDVKYEGDSGDEALDRAAYGAVTASDLLLPLPREFACPYIVFRIKFYYNPGPGDVTETNVNDQILPCVTSKIQFIRALAVTVSPSSVQVAVGTKQQFHAMITGADDSAVTWSVGGPGCEGSACGVISADGFYTAPAKIPNPATISVTATVATTPSESASSTVTIVQAGDSR